MYGKNSLRKKDMELDFLYFLFCPNLRSIDLVPNSQFGLPNYYVNVSEEIKSKITNTANNRIIYQKYLILPDNFSKF